MKIYITLTLILMGLSACGNNTPERAVSGGAIGAGVGAAGSAITGGNPVAGAVIGGATGAVIGGVTSPR